MANQFPEWSDVELLHLASYPTNGVYHVMNLLPNRTKKSIQKKAMRMGHIRSVAAGNIARQRLFSQTVTPELAWLTAMYQGDGWITNAVGTIIGITSIDKELVIYYRRCIANVCNDKTILDVKIDEISPEEAQKYQTTIKSKKTSYRLRVGAKLLCNWLREVTVNGTKIPDFILSSSKSIKLSYLAGLIDAEGCCGYCNGELKNIRVSIGMKDKNFMQDVKDLCTSVDIKTGKLKDNGTGAWVIGLNVSSLTKTDLSLQAFRKQTLIDEYKIRF